MDYTETSDVLVARIDSLVPTHPEILSMKSAWDLFMLAEFNCNDIQPSLAQATWALSVVQRKHAATA